MDLAQLSVPASATAPKAAAGGPDRAKGQGEDSPFLAMIKTGIKQAKQQEQAQACKPEATQEVQPEQAAVTTEAAPVAETEAAAAPEATTQSEVPAEAAASESEAGLSEQAEAAAQAAVVPVPPPVLPATLGELLFRQQLPEPEAALAEVQPAAATPAAPAEPAPPAASADQAQVQAQPDTSAPAIQTAVQLQPQALPAAPEHQSGSESAAAETAAETAATAQTAETQAETGKPAEGQAEEPQPASGQSSSSHSDRQERKEGREQAKPAQPVHPAHPEHPHGQLPGLQRKTLGELAMDGLQSAGVQDRQLLQALAGPERILNPQRAAEHVQVPQDHPVLPQVAHTSAEGVLSPSQPLIEAAPDLGYGARGERIEAAPAVHTAEPAETAAAPKAGKPDRFEIIRQLSDRIHLIQQARQRSIEMTLKPAELGRLSLRLHQQQANQMHLQILTELPMAKEVLESHLQQLKQQMQAQGLQLQSVSVELHPEWSRSGQQPQPQNRHNESAGGSRRGAGVFSLEGHEEVETIEKQVTHADGSAVNTLV